MRARTRERARVGWVGACMRACVHARARRDDTQVDTRCALQRPPPPHHHHTHTHTHTHTPPPTHPPPTTTTHTTPPTTTTTHPPTHLHHPPGAGDRHAQRRRGAPPPGHGLHGEGGRVHNNNAEIVISNGTGGEGLLKRPRYERTRGGTGVLRCSPHCLAMPGQGGSRSGAC